MTRSAQPILPSTEARFFGHAQVTWLENSAGVWRAWKHDPMYRGVWDDPSDALHEFSIVGEADGALSLRDALEAIAAQIWPPVIVAEGHTEPHPSAPDRELLASWSSEEKFQDRWRFPEIPGLRRTKDAEGIGRAIFIDQPTTAALEALEALAYLAAEGDDPAEELLTRALRHAHYRVRCEAIEALSFVRLWKGGTKTYRTLDEWAHVPRMPVNARPPHVGWGKPAPPYLAFGDIVELALADEDPMVRCVGLRYAVITVLQHTDGRTLVRRVALEDASPKVRSFCLQVLTQINDPEKARVAISALRDADRGVRRYALNALEYTEDPAALDAILEAARGAGSENHPELWYAIVQKARSAKAVPPDARNKIERTVLALADDPDWRVSLYLPVLLEEVDSEASRKVLQRLKGDPNPEVQAMLPRWKAWKVDMKRAEEEANEDGWPETEDE